MGRIYLSPPHMSGHEMKFVQEAFDTNWIAPLGSNVDAFEKEMCRYLGIDHALAVSSGTAALHLALRYLGVGAGDYVFCSDLTFIGSCAPIAYLGATPVFIDSEPETWNMSPVVLERAFEWAKKQGKMPKAVIVVDLYGQSADYDELLPICQHYGVPVIEDAAEALGATYKGKKCGTFGHIGVFSFNGNKIVTTSGGGMVVSNDKQAIEKMRFWATQAREPVKHYEHKEIGYNYRMSNICAGIGRGQLLILEERVAARKRVRQRYEEGLSDLPILFMPISPKGQPNYWLTVLTVNPDCPATPSEIIAALEAKNIESRPVWKPMHMQPVFCDSLFFSHSDSSVGTTLFERGVCLPSGSSLEIKEQQHIIESIEQLFKEGV